MGLRGSRVFTDPRATGGKWMLERLPRRVIAVSGFVAPAALALLGMAVLAGGCAKEGETLPTVVGVSVPQRAGITTSASGGVRAKLARREWGARTLSAL